MALVCLGLMALTTVGQTSGKKGTWKLVWQEEFDNKAGFDTTSWSKIPRGTADWNNYMSDFDSCYAVRDGNMVLRGIVNYTQKNDTAPYLTGGIYTTGKSFYRWKGRDKSQVAGSSRCMARYLDAARKCKMARWR